jgi:hypothetical protein
VQWEPVDRTAGFDPTARARDWSEAQLRRFDWLAGEELELLGYERLALDARRRRTPGFLASQVLGRLRPSSRRWPPPA